MNQSQPKQPRVYVQPSRHDMSGLQIPKYMLELVKKRKKEKEHREHGK